MAKPKIAPRPYDMKFDLSMGWDMGAYELRAMKEEQNGDFVRLSCVACETHKEGEEVQPFMRLNRGEAEALMDAMWRAGVRPTCGEGHIGELNATKEHLDSMKKIVFKQLKMEEK